MVQKKAARAPGGGFSLVEFVVVLVIVSVMAAVLLDRVRFYQEHAEKAAMEATAAAIQAGLHLRVAGYLASGRTQEISRLAQENPMDWLARKPENYAGAFDPLGAAEQVPEGSWYFDISDRSVVYRIRYGRAFVPDADGRKEVRYRADVEYGRLANASGLTGIRVMAFRSVGAYRWEID